jgi:urease subunit gamma/beta
MRLAIPAGSSIRFGPGEQAQVDLTPITGDRIAIGFAGLVDGPLDAPGAKEEALRRAVACGYQHEETMADAPARSTVEPERDRP